MESEELQKKEEVNKKANFYWSALAVSVQIRDIEMVRRNFFALRAVLGLNKKKIKPVDNPDLEYMPLGE